jgi:hypothetical protein
MENIEGNIVKAAKKVVPVNIKMLEDIKKGLNKGNWTGCTKKSIWA